MIPMIARVTATQATKDQWEGRPFAWGGADCLQVVISHLIAMGHVPTMPRPYSSSRGAARALKEKGFANLAAAMDAHGFERIAPAAALPGDVMQIPGPGVGALGIYLGNGAVLGFHEDAEGVVVVRAIEMSAAWRVPPHV